MSDLKQCPCGATPTKLAIVEGSTFRWRVVSGGCCGDWEVECRVPTVGPEANEEGALAACVREWNAMPRGWEARIAELEAENQRLREALEIISGKRQCIDNMMGNVEVAEAALLGGEG